MSAFGFGGINAHLLLEEWDSNSEAAWRPPALRLSTGGKAESKPAEFLNLEGDKLKVDSTIEKSTLSHSLTPNSEFQIPNSDIAIIGMETVFGSLNSLRDFRELIFNGASNITQRPEHRWKGCDQAAARELQNQSLIGGFCDQVSIAAGEFHIPPKEIPDILPQQLLMLKVAAAAMKDAGFAFGKNGRTWEPLSELILILKPPIFICAGI